MSRISLFLKAFEMLSVSKYNDFKQMICEIIFELMRNIRMHLKNCKVWEKMWVF